MTEYANVSLSGRKHKRKISKSHLDVPVEDTVRLHLAEELSDGQSSSKKKKHRKTSTKMYSETLLHVQTTHREGSLDHKSLHLWHAQNEPVGPSGPPEESGSLATGSDSDSNSSARHFSNSGGDESRDSSESDGGSIIACSTVWYLNLHHLHLKSPVDGRTWRPEYMGLSLRFGLWWICMYKRRSSPGAPPPPPPPPPSYWS